MLHLDIKKLGRFWRPGHRFTGDRHGASDGAGRDLVHVAIDAASRVAHGCVLPDERGTRACKAVLRRLGLRHIRTRPTRLAPMATGSDSSRPNCASGRMAGAMSTATGAPPACRAGCITKTTTASTPA